MKDSPPTKTLLEKHNEYIASIKSAGKPTKTYHCPECGHEIERPCPEYRGVIWDTAARCPKCEYGHFFIVKKIGQVRIFTLEGIEITPKSGKPKAKVSGGVSCG